MKRFIILVIPVLLVSSFAHATHQRAAEIIYKHIDGLTYEVKIITYTRNNAANDSRDYLIIDWGDGTSADLLRNAKDILVSSGEFDIVYNEYTGTHTFPGIGTYYISMEDPNRNYGVANIPQSVNVPIFVETLLVINPFIGGNNSVQLLNQPVDHGCAFRRYIHNPGAYDIDGDSLSYRLVKCRGAFGNVIPGYRFPDEVEPGPDNVFSINQYTGDVTWDVPPMTGEYNFALQIEEWRNGVLVGSVVRDMQVIIESCSIYPPVFEPVNDTCITAGELLSFDVTATTTDEVDVSLTANGGPFLISGNPAYIEPDPDIGFMKATTTFFWSPNCNQVQKEPYQVFFKAVADGYPINLAEFKTVNITVNAPAPENLTAEAQLNSIKLAWSEYKCPNAKAFKIYRRSGPYDFQPGYCETGVPFYTGFEFIHKTQDADILEYYDNNYGQGLTHGINYCYMITAIFSDSAESFVSNQACAALKRDLPVITNVSNNLAQNLNGMVYIAWSKPVDLDTLEYPGPYRYEVLRAEGLSGDNFFTIGNNTGGLNDTIYFDNNVNINTSGIPYRYRLDLYSGSIGFIGSSTAASTLFLKLYATDKAMVISWDANVPWFNSGFTIYRLNNVTAGYDSIGYTESRNYRDTQLINGTEYCYYARSTGSYSTPGITDPLINFSQKICAIPYDNVPPCPPVLTVEPDCEETTNFLIWNNRYDTCAYDIEKYLIFYSLTSVSNLTLLDSTYGRDDTTYLHAGMESILGCYAIKAVDSIGNISSMSNIFCVDTTCGGFRLPNAFTPNNDQYNDYFMAFPNTLSGVAKIDLVILNRWGKKVYETQDKYFKWDGRDKYNNRECPEAVYFFICDVYEIDGDDLMKRTINGSVTIFR